MGTTYFLELYATGLVLAAMPLLGLLPCYWAVDPDGFRNQARRGGGWLSGLGYLLAGGGVVAFVLYYNSDTEVLTTNGRYYAAGLSLLFIVDALILLPQLLILVWPKGGAVALAAFREGWRQWTFWLLVIVTSTLLFLSMVLPYFTLGDDYKMMKFIGLDLIKLVTVLFAVLTASISINEEIEGRTAVTVISKPVSRRQFVVGKYLGILMAALAMTVILAWVFNWVMWAKPAFEKSISEVTTDPIHNQAVAAIQPAFKAVLPGQAGDAVAVGVSDWFGQLLGDSLGYLLGFGQVMMMLALAAAFATRLSFVINLVLLLGIFFAGNLAPVLVEATTPDPGDGEAGVGLKLVNFVAQAFDAVLPHLSAFDVGPAVIRDRALDLVSFAWYVATVVGTAMLYSAAALFLALVFFEDRDLS